jgi:hypothetical protein
MKIHHTEDYAKLRRAAYPPMEEFADAMYWKEKGDNGPWLAYVAKVDAVKNRFKKAAEAKSPQPPIPVGRQPA